MHRMNEAVPQGSLAEVIRSSVENVAQPSLDDCYSPHSATKGCWLSLPPPRVDSLEEGVAVRGQPLAQEAHLPPLPPRGLHASIN